MPGGLLPKVGFSVSDTSFDDTPRFTPPASPAPEPPEQHSTFNMADPKLNGSQAEKKDAPVEKQEPDGKQSDNKDTEIVETKSKKSSRRCKHQNNQDKKKAKKSRKQEKDSSDDSSDSSSSSSSESESDSDEESEQSSSSSSEDESRKRKSKRGKKSRRDHKKSKKSRRRDDSSDEGSGSDSSEEESESENERRSRKSKKRSKRRRRDASQSESEEPQEEEDPVEKVKEMLKSIGVKAKNINIDIGQVDEDEEGSDDNRRNRKSRRSRKGGKKKRDPKKPAFFRGDELWDKENYQYELKPTKTRVKAEKHSDYVFTVKRHFDWEGKYEYTDVHIHGRALREALAKVMENCKAVSLAEEQPVLEPDMLFLYLEDMRQYRKDLKAVVAAKKLKKKVRKALEIKMAQLKCMIKYLDKDYASTKATLYPLLEQGTITFDLLWTLFRSETLVYTSTYGNESEPRAYRVDYCNKEQSFTKGVWYEISGKYFDFDGKDFGLGGVQADIESFRGVRKISSLAVYPIQYHPKYEQVRSELIERGKKFVSLAGMQYKFLKGMAFMKRRGQIMKINVNGRIMCDPATFRRINPNYMISNVKREDPDILSDCESDEDPEEEKADPCNCQDCLANDPNAFAQRRENENEPKKRWKRVRDPKTKMWDYIQVEVDDNGQEIRNSMNPAATTHELESLKANDDDEEEDEAPGTQDTFTDDELLIASPVILGFAFSEKLWVEMSVSGIQEITWNEGAFDSLVLPPAQKDIIKALVTAHSKEAKAENRAEAKGEIEGKAAGPQQNIDDVIQGKGKGLVSVLHGTPGTGKTLTAEGIAELLKCPLYCVSAGELGTNPQSLEAELTKILDVAHAWGAVLLLDEADVFLEARTAQDIHRNALVSIFLRLLEYFQGILFLTTNRVASFDEAFQSRIHIALRYQELDFKARRKVWEMFLAKVRGLEHSKVDEFGKDDLDRLARKDHLNGRQIKNAVRSAQALALNEKVNLSMKHIEKVLQVAESFERDLKGGSGYADAMRSYT